MDVGLEVPKRLCLNVEPAVLDTVPGVWTHIIVRYNISTALLGKGPNLSLVTRTGPEGL